MAAMREEFSVRSARRSDITAIKLIEIELNLSPWSERDYRLEIDRGDSIFLVCVRDDTPVGFVLARLITNTQSDLISKNLQQTKNLTSTIEIFNIGVTPSHQRRGLATELLSALLRDAASFAPSQILLDVRSGNTGAKAFYERHDFKPIGSRRNFYTNPVDDSIVMRRLLSPQDDEPST